MREEIYYQAISIFIIIIILSVLGFRVKAFYDSQHSVKDAMLDVPLEGYIWNHPYRKGDHQILQIKNKYITAPLFPEYYAGQYIIISGFKDISNADCCIFFPKIEIGEDRSIKSLLILSQFRAMMIQRVQKNLPEPYAGLILGMTIGYKASFTESFRQQLIDGGIIHIIVVSGYNVSLLLNLITPFASRFGKVLFNLIGVIFLFIYLLLVGFDPPILRAIITGIIVAYGASRGFQRSSMYILFIVAVFLLFLRPSYLGDLSFQLSFTATFAVIHINKSLEILNEFIRAILTNFYVYLLIAPIILSSFGVFSLNGLVLNLLIVDLVGIITILGILYLLFPTFLIGFVIVALLDYILVFTRAFNFKVIAIHGNFNNFIFLGVYYVFWIVVVYLLGLKYKRE